MLMQRAISGLVLNDLYTSFLLTALLIELTPGRQGSHLGCGFAGRANSNRAGLLDEHCDQAVVDAAFDEQSRASDTALTAGSEDAGDDGIRGTLKVGISEYDNR